MVDRGVFKVLHHPLIYLDGVVVKTLLEFDRYNSSNLLLRLFSSIREV